jgi:hypothetical protein
VAEQEPTGQRSTDGIDKASDAVIRERRRLERQREPAVPGPEPEEPGQEGGSPPDSPSAEDELGWERRPRDWRLQVATASALSLLAGVWLIVSPLVVNYASADPVWNVVICGCVIALCGLLRVSGSYRAHWMSWVTAVAGAWLVVSAILLDHSARAAGNDIVVGVIVFGLGVYGASARRRTASARKRTRRERLRTGGPAPRGG